MILGALVLVQALQENQQGRDELLVSRAAEEEPKEKRDSRKDSKINEEEALQPHHFERPTSSKEGGEQNPKRRDEPQQPDAVAKPNLPQGSKAPPKQQTEPAKTKPFIKSGGEQQSDEKQGSNTNTDNNKSSGDSSKATDNTKVTDSSKSGKKAGNKSDEDEAAAPKQNYTVPKRRTQSQYSNDSVRGFVAPGTVIGSLVLILALA